jgi:hypothetical protein
MRGDARVVARRIGPDGDGLASGHADHRIDVGDHEVAHTFRSQSKGVEISHERRRAVHGQATGVAPVKNDT